MARHNYPSLGGVEIFVGPNPRNLVINFPSLPESFGPVSYRIKGLKLPGSIPASLTALKLARLPVAAFTPAKRTLDFASNLAFLTSKSDCASCNPVEVSPFAAADKAPAASLWLPAPVFKAANSSFLFASKANPRPAPVFFFHLYCV